MCKYGVIILDVLSFIIDHWLTIFRSLAMDQRNTLYRQIVSNLKEEGLENEEATAYARQAVRTGILAEPIGYGSHVSPIEIVDDACKEVTVDCDANDKFRSFDGRCNNLNNPYWGARSIALPREINVGEYNPKANPVFLDSTEKSAGTASGIYNSTARTLTDRSKSTVRTNNVNTCLERGTLPSARFVSQAFHTSKDIDSSKATHMLTQWGQFLSHDNTLTPFDFSVSGCCPLEVDSDDDCFPLFVSTANDPFYQGHGVTCLSFTRSTAYCEENQGPRQQMNAINSFVDASNVYGS